MKHRKTLHIEIIRTRANAFLANSTNDQTEQRKAYHDLAAGLLSEANAYCGFRYLTEADVKSGQTFGITHGNPAPTFHDETRTQLL